MTEGDENDFRLDSDTINLMKQLTVSKSKQYKFIIQFTDKLFALRDHGIIFKSDATGIEYLREMCAEKAVQPLGDAVFSIGDTKFVLTGDATYPMLSILISMQKDVQGESHPVTHDANGSN